MFAGPGAGKSTVAASLFSRMKKSGISVELATEYAKDLIWSDARQILKDQILLLAEQNHRLQRLVGKVDYIINDSPIILPYIYAKDLLKEGECLYSKDLVNELKKFCIALFYEYHNKNFFILRGKSFQQSGRVHDEEHSRKLDNDIMHLLKDLKKHDSEDLELIKLEEAEEKILEKLKVKIETDNLS